MVHSFDNTFRVMSRKELEAGVPIEGVAVVFAAQIFNDKCMTIVVRWLFRGSSIVVPQWFHCKPFSNGLHKPALGQIFDTTWGAKFSRPKTRASRPRRLFLSGAAAAMSILVRWDPAAQHFGLQSKFLLLEHSAVQTNVKQGRIDVKMGRPF
ncbi:unnamed protein product [Cladocopium goreaui]|uniref:Uncharacterized protein n=1 Tax=Cladocopium goreaui TaxID=2562237 RepID=A0A9P1BGD7_9DINO|nr:unnamed protein product [Cladocopium goreaui]